MAGVEHWGSAQVTARHTVMARIQERVREESDF